MRKLAALGALVLWSALFASEAAAQSHHTVRAGQTLGEIARRYRVEIWDLAGANRMTPTDLLRPGVVLEVPPPGLVFVRPGDTLQRIARHHGCSVDALARQNRLTDRSTLRVGQELRLPGFAAVSTEAVERDWGEPERPGYVRFSGRTNDAEVQLVDESRRVHPEGLRVLGQVLRHDEEDPVDVPDPRLAAMLALVSDHFGGRPIIIVSGFREARGYTSEESRHVSGNAADIRIEGVPARLIWDFCRSLVFTGCGLYPRSSFVHVDTREDNAQWVDWSAPGQRPRYGTLRRAYRRSERGARRQRVGREITRADALPEAVEIANEPRATGARRSATGGAAPPGPGVPPPNGRE
jgi:uncharacterized protein YcbK (DUF882 family)